MGQLKPVVILSTADYHSAVWTNKQHIASRLAATHDVVYIDSLGLRAPRLNKADALRLLERVLGGRSVRGKNRSLNAARVPKVISPRVIPWHNSRLVRMLNERLLSRWWRKLPDAFDLWTFSPLTYGLEKLADKVVYQSVDLLHEFENVPRETLLQAERILVRSAHHVVASSRVIADHLIAIGAQEVEVWENVADAALFASASSHIGVDRDRQGAIFAGNMSASKIDFELLVAVADTGYQLILAGPIAIDGSSVKNEVEKLLRRSNVTYLGNLSQDELAHSFASAKIGLIPYKLNEYTRGVFPMKVHEYRASGLRVVSTRLPSLVNAQYEGLTLTDQADFAGAVVREYGLAPLVLSDEALGKVSWDRRLAQVRAVLGSPADCGKS